MSYSESPEKGVVQLSKSSDVRSVDYSGKTWCVTVPSGFIITRRAFQVENVVTKASVPTILGNCKVGF